jgi:hypothetical protein
MITESRAKNCVSHHHACDCREYKFQQLEERVVRLLVLLERSRKYVEDDVSMISAISRHAPLDKESQEVHDTTVYLSEVLLPEIDEELKKGLECDIPE